MPLEIPNINEVQKLFTKYSDFQFVDKGGFKIVYSAITDGIKEAVKLVYVPAPNDIDAPDHMKDDFIEESKNRILRELHLLENSSSPYIVKLGKLKPIDIKINKTEFIVYSEEFIEGKSVYKLIKEGYKPSEDELRSLLICLLRAIENLWVSFKAIHRDIKPMNVIKTNITPRPFVLLDLGIAFLINETPLTVAAGNRFPPPGTTKYLSPEMLDPNFRNTIDFRSDLYTAGILVYEYATGIHPLAKSGDDLLMTLSRIMREKPKPVEEYRNDLSNELCEVINNLIKKLVALRPASISKIIEKIEGK
ncbi:MAG: serine/threonine protein kinase [Melioribacteraceae bacterium]